MPPSSRLSRRIAGQTFSPEARRFMWPDIVTRELPGAYEVCRWAADEKAMVHPALYLRETPKKGIGVFARRSLPKGTPLMSIPEELVMASDEDGRTDGMPTPMHQLVHALARGLHDQTCPWYDYLQFLHDIHNLDSDLEEIFDDYGVEMQVDTMLDGNVIDIEGVHNAPFMTRSELRFNNNRLQVDRLRRFVRDTEQGVPHFSANAVRWALSMALSRSWSPWGLAGVPPPERRDHHHEVVIVPLVDLCNHSFNPAAHLYATDSRQRVSSLPKELGAVTGRGVKGWSRDEPHYHLVAIRDIAAGGEVTLQYEGDNPHLCDTPDAVLELQEWWRCKYAFEPSSEGLQSEKFVSSEQAAAMAASVLRLRKTS